MVNEQNTQPTQPKVKLEEEKPIDQPFTLDKIHEIWPSFVERFADQVHLYNTLLNLPDLQEGNMVVITVENSVQQEKIRLMKPEIIGHLRRTLHNSTIDVRVDLIRTNTETKVFTDDQKIKAMMEKNPALTMLKNKFNLDFNG